MDRIVRKLLELGFSPEQIQRDIPMSQMTTMRVGGKAELLLQPQNGEQVSIILALAEEENTPVLVMGGGSNLIVRDGGIRGIVLRLGENYARSWVEDTVLIAQAGIRLSALCQEALRYSLAGLEFASGIPGTLGGGVAMNAGAYGGEMKDCLLWADVLRSGEVQRLTKDDLKMGYRSTTVLSEGGIVLQAAFQLTKDDPEAIAARIHDLNTRRRDKQPLNYPSSGSTFKRPTGYYAGALIQEAGMKGVRVGGAQVSEKHSGFVINADNASARDVLDLIALVQERVFENSGVHLECEVRIVGED